MNKKIRLEQRLAACCNAAAVLLLVVLNQSYAEVYSYECDTFPEQSGWTIFQIYCNPELSIESSQFLQPVDLCPGVNPPGGQLGAYFRYLDSFLGQPTFFAEWVVDTDADPSELIWGGGANISVANSTFSSIPVNYVFSHTETESWLNNVWAGDVIEILTSPGWHRHRLELYTDQLFLWWIDGELVASGTPTGNYLLDGNPRINFRAKAVWLPNLTKWDYIRYGTIPSPGTGDYDSSLKLTNEDWYFFNDCIHFLSGPGIYGGPARPCPPDDEVCVKIACETGEDSCSGQALTTAGPGCTFADMDADGDVDLRDVAIVYTMFDGE